MYRHLFVPTDGSDLAIDTVARAVAFASALGAHVTFFCARADYGATDEGALERTLSPAVYAERAAGEARAVIAKAEAEARAAGIAFSSVIRTSDRPFEAILDVAEECGCDLIFMASHGRRGLRGLLLGSQTQKVLAHTRIPVLVSSVESNQAAPEMNAAIAIIQQEHRSFAAVAHGLLEELRQLRVGHSPPNYPLLRAMVNYIRLFPETLHHPKEESYLFARLRQRSGAVDEAITESLRQHAEGHVLFEELRCSLDDYENSGGCDFAPLMAAADRFAESLWAHMRLEEKVILPAARKYLLEEDWIAIGSALGENGDPRFSLDNATAYKELFVRIMNSMAGDGGPA